MKTMAILTALTALLGCSTYRIPTKSFEQQLGQYSTADMRTVRTKGPAGDVVEYHSLPIDYIKCVDKREQPVSLKNSPSIEIRFTKSDGKRTIMYFDTVFIQDSVVYGRRSRFLGYPATIPLKDIESIEIQDGRKRFKYVK